MVERLGEVATKGDAAWVVGRSGGVWRLGRENVGRMYVERTWGVRVLCVGSVRAGCEAGSRRCGWGRELTGTSFMVVGKRDEPRPVPVDEAVAGPGERGQPFVGELKLAGGARVARGAHLSRRLARADEHLAAPAPRANAGLALLSKGAHGLLDLGLSGERESVLLVRGNVPRSLTAAHELEVIRRSTQALWTRSPFIHPKDG